MKLSKILKENIYSAGIIKANFYNYFYKVFFYYPDLNFIGYTSKLIPYFENLKKFISNNEYSVAINILKQYEKYEKNTEDKEEVLDLLHDLYKELFISAVFCIPSTASEYMKKPTERDKVLSIYESSKFQIPENTEFPCDHISIEMLYMQQLNSALVSTINSDNDDLTLSILKNQYNFLQAHIGNWINEFIIYLKEQITNPASNLYYAAAIIMNEIVMYDKQLTSNYLEQIKKLNDN